MPRRRTKWWTGLVATRADLFIEGPEGTELVRLLSDWWIEGEGIAGGLAGSLVHTSRAVKARYQRDEFYAMLARHRFPHLSDRDEHAIDAVHSAFVTWASSRKARTLIDSITMDSELRRKIDQAIRSGTDERLAELADGLRHEVHDLIHDHVHAHVNHELTHAVHYSGHGGGHDGGGHGGH